MITVLLSITVGYLSYRYGWKKGAAETYRLCLNAEQSKREFFSAISRW